MTNPFADIERFGSACDQEPNEANYKMYLTLIDEEVGTNLKKQLAANDRVEQLDALVDILVVTMGAIEQAALTAKVHGKK